MSDKSIESPICKNLVEIDTKINQLEQDLYDATFNSPSEEQKNSHEQARQLILKGERPNMVWSMTFTLEDAQKLMNATHSELINVIKKDADYQHFVEEFANGKVPDNLQSGSITPYAQYALARISVEQGKGLFPLLAEIFNKDPNLFLPTREVIVNGEKIQLGEYFKESIIGGPMDFIYRKLEELKASCGIQK